MIIIVETNFILELALQREQESACREILDLCQPGQVGRLVMPAFAIAEAAMALERSRGLRRRFVHHEVTSHVEDLQRSKPRQRLVTLLWELKDELARAEIEEPENLLRVVFDKDTECVETIEMTQAVVRTALMYHDLKVVPRLPDALVFASVVTYLTAPRNSPAYFVSRDQEFVSAIAGELRKRNCLSLRSFTDAAALLRHR